MNVQLILYNLLLHKIGLPAALTLKYTSSRKALQGSTALLPHRADAPRSFENTPGSPPNNEAPRPAPNDSWISRFWRGRFGHYDLPRHDPSRPRLWIHAASVGEVTGAMPTLHALEKRYPRACVFLSTATPQGFRFAASQLPPWVRVIPFPLDFPWVLNRAFNTLRPDLYVGLETELWPNLLRKLETRRIPAVLLNGRLSAKSAGYYRKCGGLFRDPLSHFSTLAMLTEQDRDHMLSLGASRERTCVVGSSKYDALALRAQNDRSDHWRRMLGIAPHTPVVVGGSLRRSECTRLLEVFPALRRDEPSLVGIFAPRHLERIPAMAQWLEAQGISYRLLTDLEKDVSEKRRASLVLVDKIGVLFELYSIGTLIFCGGTLEPVGGHNILEPAAWSRPVFYGPHLQKVTVEHNMLHSLGGGFMVKDADDLLEHWRYWLKELPQLERHGAMAAEALKNLSGATDTHLRIIESALSELAKA